MTTFIWFEFQFIFNGCNANQTIGWRVVKIHIYQYRMGMKWHLGLFGIKMGIMIAPTKWYRMGCNGKLHVLVSTGTIWMTNLKLWHQRLCKNNNDILFGMEGSVIKTPIILCRMGCHGKFYNVLSKCTYHCWIVQWDEYFDFPRVCVGQLLLSSVDWSLWSVECMVGGCSLYQYSEAETKWPTFCRRHFQMHFLEWKCMNFA